MKIWLLLLCLWACGKAMSLPYFSPVSEYATDLQLDLAPTGRNVSLRPKSRKRNSRVKNIEAKK